MIALKLSNLVATVAFADPSGGKTPDAQAVKGLGARSAIVVVGTDALTRVFVLYAWAQRCATTRFLEQLYFVADTFQPRPFCIEANAMQSLFVDCAEYIRKMHSQHQVQFSKYVQPSHLNKTFRNRTAIQPVLAQGRLFLSDDPSQQELQAELRVHPRSATRDLVDCLATCCSLLPRVAPPRNRRQDEADALAAYLRDRGTAASEIERRISEILSTS